MQFRRNQRKGINLNLWIWIGSYNDFYKGSITSIKQFMYLQTNMMLTCFIFRSFLAFWSLPQFRNALAACNEIVYHIPRKLPPISPFIHSIFLVSNSFNQIHLQSTRHLSHRRKKISSLVTERQNVKPNIGDIRVIEGKKWKQQKDRMWNLILVNRKYRQKGGRSRSAKNSRYIKLLAGYNFF